MFSPSMPEYLAFARTHQPSKRPQSRLLGSITAGEPALNFGAPLSAHEVGGFACARILFEVCSIEM